MNCSICNAEFWLKSIYKFAKTPESIDKFGDALEDPKNKQLVCHACIVSPHHSKKIVSWDENQFIAEVMPPPTTHSPASMSAEAPVTEEKKKTGKHKGGK